MRKVREWSSGIRFALVEKQQNTIDILLEDQAMLPFKTILFATDFSPASRVAFGIASALARDYKAHMIAIHVVEPARVGFR